MWASPFAGTVRAVFDNLVAFNQMASRDGPGDETPSSAPRLRDLLVQWIPLALRLVAAGARAKSRRIALRKMLNLAKQTHRRQVRVSITLVAGVPSIASALRRARKAKPPFATANCSQPGVSTSISPRVPRNWRQPSKATENASRLKQSHRITTQLLYNSSLTMAYIIRGEKSPGGQTQPSQKVLGAGCGARARGRGSWALAESAGC